MSFRDEEFRITRREITTLVDACELTPDERKEFDYLNWAAIDEGRDSASFFRRTWADGTQLYDLSEFTDAPREARRLGWHAFAADTFFSGILVRFDPDDSDVIWTALLLA
jgi:hypothetical protein